MKKLLFTILILFSFITNIFAEETIGYVNGTEVNFRNEPSLNSKVISQLNRPEEIIILDIVVTSDIKYKYWYKIKTKENEIGYIYYLLVVTDPKLIGSDLKKSLKEVIFYDSKLGPIKFSNKLPITIKLLKKIFPEHKVTKGIGQGDSPDFYYFGVSKENKTIQISSFIQYKDYNLKQIKSPHQNNINIDLLAINSNEIKDQYGLSVGDTYKDIIRKRKGELVIRNSHHDKTIGKDQIYYSIWGNFDNKSYADVSPVNIPNEQVIKHNWEIISISWPSPIW